MRSNPTLFRNADGSVKTTREAVASLERRFEAQARAVGRTRLSALEPIGVPTDEGTGVG